MVSKSRTIAADIAELTLTLEPGKDPGGNGAGNRGKTRLVRLIGLTELIAGIDCAWRRAAHEGCPQMPVLNLLPGSPGGFARRLP